MINYQDFKQIMGSLGLKATGQRFAILQYLRHAKAHLSADMIFDALAKEMPALARDTVYRALANLSEAGLLKKVPLPGGPMHFDGNLNPHQHFVCNRCSKIYDFDWPELDQLPFPAKIEKVGSVTNFSVLTTGLCEDCLNQNH